MSVALGPTDRTLLNGWQRAFPLSPRPFAEIADIVGLGEQEVLARFASLKERDLISRIGAVVRPNTVGASTLAAMAVPPAQLENVVRRVNAEPTVNHNYEREHRLNLWFVVTALDRAAVQATIARLSHDSGLDVFDLPLERAYHIDLGFDLEMPGDRKRAGCIGQEPNPRLQPDADDCKLLSTLEDGLRLVPRPYAEAAQRIGWRESGVTVRLARGLL